MKVKCHKMDVLNYMISTEKFKVIFILIIILALYGSVVLGVSSYNFLDSILIPLQFGLFNIFMFILLFINTFNTCTTFNKNFSHYIMRLDNKKNYVKTMLKNTIFLNLYFFLLFFILFFALLFLFKAGHIEIHSYQNYVINNLIYVLYYVIKYIVLAIFITSFSALSYLYFGGKITLLFNTLFLVGFTAIPFYDSIFNYPTLIPWHHFMGISYSSFLTEIASTALLLFVLELLFYGFYTFIIKKGKIIIL